MSVIQVFHALIEAQNSSLEQAKSRNPAELPGLATQYLNDAEGAYTAAVSAAQKQYPPLVSFVAEKMESHRQRLRNIGQEIVDARDAGIRKVFDDAVSAVPTSRPETGAGDALRRSSESPKITESSISIAVDGNTIVVDGDRNPVEPHLAKWMEMLLEGRLEGNKVSGLELLALPGANGKKIGREFDKLVEQIPKLKGIITSQSGRGGGWYLQC